MSLKPAARNATIRRPWEAGDDFPLDPKQCYQFLHRPYTEYTQWARNADGELEEHTIEADLVELALLNRKRHAKEGVVIEREEWVDKDRTQLLRQLVNIARARYELFEDSDYIPAITIPIRICRDYQVLRHIYTKCISEAKFVDVAFNDYFRTMQDVTVIHFKDSSKHWNTYHVQAVPAAYKQLIYRLNIEGGTPHVKQK